MYFIYIYNPKFFSTVIQALIVSGQWKNLQIGRLKITNHAVD